MLEQQEVQLWWPHGARLLLALCTAHLRPAKCHPVPDHASPACHPQGIFEAATYIHCSTQEALQEAARRCPGWPLLVTGHSLGGKARGWLAWVELGIWLFMKTVGCLHHLVAPICLCIQEMGSSHPDSCACTMHFAGGVAALLTLLLQDTGTLPPAMGSLRCITMGTGGLGCALRGLHRTGAGAGSGAACKGVKRARYAFVCCTLASLLCC